jgi:agmatine deiminase
MSDLLSTTPAALGYRWAAEWEPQASVWLSWPRNPKTWPGHFESVPEEFAQFVRLLAEYEMVNVLAGGREVMDQARALVGGIRNVVLHDIATNDAWCRDHGPTFLSSVDRALPPALLDWQYNAWGGKYPPFDLDNAVPQRIGSLQGRRVFSPGIVLEGGAIEGNGRGCVLTTESCLLNANRNVGMTKERAESYLRDYLGAQKILWLTGGEIVGDDTDGHIDQIARFVDERTVVVSVCEDVGDENYGPSQQNLGELRGLTDQDGQPLDIVPLKLPEPLFCDEQRLPGSYANFLIANGVVNVPAFGVEADAEAVATLAPLFPGRDVRPCPSRKLAWGLGSFHCLSQQEPMACLP